MAYAQDFRQLSAQYLAQGQWDMAYETLVDLWNQQPSLATAHYLLASYERLRQHVPVDRNDLVRETSDAGQADGEVWIVGKRERVSSRSERTKRAKSGRSACMV